MIYSRELKMLKKVCILDTNPSIKYNWKKKENPTDSMHKANCELMHISKLLLRHLKSIFSKNIWWNENLSVIKIEF